MFKLHFPNNPIHSSQRSRWIEKDGQKYLDVHLDLKINLEFMFTLNRFFNKIKVLSPQSLVDDLNSSIHETIERYNFEA